MTTMTEPTVDEGGRAILTGISSRAFEHPADRAALTAMRSIPGGAAQLLRCPLLDGGLGPVGLPVTPA